MNQDNDNQHHHQQEEQPPPPPQQQYFREPSRRKQALHAPAPRRTNPFTWLAAVLCILFWLIVILGGVAVLIVYLFFRPRSPRFDISSATFNAAYLDSGNLLNADLTLLANFTNPNQRVGISFHYAVIDLYYGDTLLSTQSIRPFGERSGESKLVNVHLLSSQVLLPLGDVERLQKEATRNKVTFHVRGTFRTRSNFGSFFHFSYWLYGRCGVVVGGPPSGVMVSRRCRTKR